MITFQIFFYLAFDFIFLIEIQILVFNCMSVRDPELLLPRLFNACTHEGMYISYTN